MYILHSTPPKLPTNNENVLKEITQQHNTYSITIDLTTTIGKPMVDDLRGSINNYYIIFRVLNIIRIKIAGNENS